MFVFFSNAGLGELTVHCSNSCNTYTITVFVNRPSCVERLAEGSESDIS